MDNSCQLEFRSSERRLEFVGWLSYKHLTPHGVKQYFLTSLWNFNRFNA